MSKKKIKRILIILSIFLMLITITINCVQAASGSGLTSIFNGNENGSGPAAGESFLKKIIGPILSAIRIVATGISVIMLTFLGIKYMSAAPTEKASIKNQLISFTVGAIVVIGTTKILEVIRDTAQEMTK